MVRWRIENINFIKNTIKRKGSHFVALKVIKDNKYEFLDLDTSLTIIMRLYEENARSLIARDYWKLPWVKRWFLLLKISEELNIMHGYELKHGDLHSGNLLYDEMTHLLFLILATDHFWYRPYNQYLALEICQGLRPKIPEHTPVAYVELMIRCWDSDPKKRPDSEEILDCFDQFTKMVIDYVKKLFVDEKENAKLPNKEEVTGSEIFKLFVDEKKNAKLPNREEVIKYFTEFEIKVKSFFKR
ncbi:serine/threonine protein kinase [Gigaspora margarita]|uniref:Serine/threonine protein kinase n=1 Tax=Gigaspora margarita TaxID=4874 RepID=A0A8H3X5Q0_GIGMA|nr:serine/threonine protein kinase [Gigaspora margarita]